MDVKTRTIIKEQISRIHGAVNDGTLDRDAVNDALSRLMELTKETEPVETDKASKPPAEPATNNPKTKTVDDNQPVA